MWVKRVCLMVCLSPVLLFWAPQGLTKLTDPAGLAAEEARTSARVPGARWALSCCLGNHPAWALRF